jgi:subtilisin family serine protease
MSLTIPGTSNSVITVGGYLTKSWWYNPDGTLQGWPSTYGAFVVSSGEGPTRDGRQKPDLAVPTTRIATARSSTYSPNPINIVEDGVHVVMSGTSMAVPHMTGAVALALQKDPTATASEIKSFVISTARSDSLTGTVPNTRWGHGKLDIQAAMNLIPLYTGVSGARAQSTDTLVKLAGQVVSAGLDQLGDRFYVEPPDRSSGIQIRRASGDQPIEADVVTVVGTTGLIGGEAGILNSTITRTGTGGDVPNPVMLINRSLGGRSAGSWIPGVTGGTGLNNIGLLARSAGNVTYIGGDHFYIDDGTNLVGNGQIGVKVYCPGLTKPISTDQHAVVTGISSLELVGATTYPVLRPRKQSDLVYY